MMMFKMEGKDVRENKLRDPERKNSKSMKVRGFKYSDNRKRICMT